jgi:ATP-binding cassette subfamily B multidrug efflux pump
MTEDPYAGKPLLTRVMSLAVPYRGLFASAILLSLILSALAPVRPYLMQQAVDLGILKRDGDYLILMILFMAAALAIEGVTRYSFNLLTSHLGQQIIRALRLRVFNHLLYAKVQYFDETPIGTTTTRTITDIEAIQDTFSEGVITLFADVMLVIITLSFMFQMNWKLAICSIATFPLLFLFTRWFQQGVKKSYQEERVQIARMNSFLQEHISGMRIVQLFNAEEQEYQKFEAINRSLRDANVRGIWYYSLFFPAVEIISSLSVGLMVWIASQEILHQQAEPGIIMAFILYINNLFRPLRFMADKVNTIQRGVVASERVFKLLDTELTLPLTGTRQIATLQGAIRFDRVWFSYKPEQWVLRDFCLDVKSGEMVALVGHTGAGKSSVIQLLGRQYDIQRGAIFIDEIPLADYDMTSLRNRMAFVLQDVFLFAGSIYENITLRNGDISMAQVIQAAEQIGADEFIRRLPGGYEYRVQERGATLSMGQRQLIAFIRAMVYNPDLLVLDEATSSVDSESERLIQQAIEKLVTGRTSIVIAHRLSTIRHANKIIVLEKGQVIEQGTHQELMETKGKYFELYTLQFAVQQKVE